MIIDRFAGVPAYEQVIALTKDEIRAGVYPAGTQIPSVREVSQDAGINPNTVQRAYTELVRQGFLKCAQGLGYFVVDNIDAKIQEDSKIILEEIEAGCRKVRQAGVSKSTMVTLINKIWM